MDSTTRRTHCFIEEDDGLASLADVEARKNQLHHHHHNLIYRPLTTRSVSPRNSVYMRNNSFSSVSSSRSGRFFYGNFQENQPHFLDSCFLCSKPLCKNRDIYMYRGDLPFCTEECRQEQIDTDDAKEKNLKASMKSKSLRKTEQRNSNSPNKRYPFRSGAVAAA